LVDLFLDFKTFLKRIIYFKLLFYIYIFRPFLCINIKIKFINKKIF
jgi:hypothetical protein